MIGRLDIARGVRRNSCVRIATHEHDDSAFGSTDEEVDVCPHGSELLSKKGWSFVAHELHLSPREVEVVVGVFDDEKEFAIANRLGISPHTVNCYLQRIYSKLHVHSRTQLVIRVIMPVLSRIQAT